MRAPSWNRLTRGGVVVALGLGLVGVASQLHCAEAVQDWPDQIDLRRPGDGGTQGDGDGTWHCFTGTPTTEDEFFNKCTEADKVDRPSNIPATTWDGQSPLPGS